MSKTIENNQIEELQKVQFKSKDIKGNSQRTIGVLFSPNNSTECTRDYLDFAKQYGQVRLVMPDEFKKDLDLLIIPGGMDMNASTRAFLPSISFNHGCTDPYFEYFRSFILDVYIENEIPIFGICLGFQLLAARFNSKLFPDISGHTSGMHYVETTDLRIKVNTYHHQAIKELGEELIPLAYSTTKNGKKELVEAFTHKEYKISGVQWHPERMLNLVSSSTFIETGNLRGDLITNQLINNLLTP